MNNKQQKALDYINDLEVTYQEEVDQFSELRKLLSELEDSILILPFLGLYPNFEDIMRDKMIMYRAQFQALVALQTYLRENVMRKTERSEQD